MTRRRLWIYRRLMRNWYRSHRPERIEQQLEDLTDPTLLDRMAV